MVLSILQQLKDFVHNILEAFAMCSNLLELSSLGELIIKGQGMILL
jgi:hypothetical protein